MQVRFYETVEDEKLRFAVIIAHSGPDLLFCRHRDRDTYEMPGGHREPGESIEACARRELEEETGYRSENLEWLINLRTTVAFCNEKIEVFVAKNLIPSRQHLDEDEFIDLGAYTMEELKEKIYSGEIEDAKTVSALLAYEVKYCK